MRAFVLPVIAVGVIFFAHTDEPTENQMRGAFESSLAAEVADTMAFIGESGGSEAVERVRMAGNDRFEIRNFRKVDCQPMATKSGFGCAFIVNIILANGPMQRALKGRFYNTQEGIQFALDESQDIASPTLAESTQGRYTESKDALKNASNFNGE
jgi:hypothetical protein